MQPSACLLLSTVYNEVIRDFTGAKGKHCIPASLEKLFKHDI